MSILEAMLHGPFGGDIKGCLVVVDDPKHSKDIKGGAAMLIMDVSVLNPDGSKDFLCLLPDGSGHVEVNSRDVKMLHTLLKPNIIGGALWFEALRGLLPHE